MTDLRTMRLAHALPLAFGLAFACPEALDLGATGAVALPAAVATAGPAAAPRLAAAAPARRRAEA